MKMSERTISTKADLLDAAANPEIRSIVVTADLDGLSAFRLSPGQALTAAAPNLSLCFAPGQDGLELSTDNRVEGLALRADPDRRAVFNDAGVAGLGRLILRDRGS